MADSFEQLRAEFLAETEDTLGVLQQDLNQLEQAHRTGSLPDSILDRVFRTTHSLKGVAGMFGLTRMSQVSHAMENVLEEVRRGDVAMDGDLLDLLHRGNGILHDLLGTADEPEDDEAPVVDLIGGIAAALDTRRPAAGPSDNPVAATILRLEPQEREAVARAAASGRTVLVVEALLSEDAYEEPFRELLTAVREWGIVHGTVSSERSVEGGAFRVRLVASGPEEIFPLMKRVGPLGGEVLFGRLPKPSEPATADDEDPAPPSEQFPTVRVEEIDLDDLPLSPGSEVPRPAADAPPRRGSTLRVPVERVDRLLNELGDLMQAKMILDETARSILASVPDRLGRTQVTQSLRSVDRHLKKLQERILGVRLVGLDPLFHRLERTFREACRVTGRNARLGTHGDAPELDKEVLDALTEPLVHLVRNAVDHGIEDEATRRAAGKDPCGTVTISARTEGPHALLEVSDDGGGLDFDRIRELAIERGLMDEGSEPTRAELRELLFHPGFTVKTEATEISGRGVGLDAVRDAVTRIGGVVEIDEPGVGSRFRLRVPITLSILPALEVEAAGQVAFVPLAHVRRVLRVDDSRLERGPERTLFVEGDHAVPVARLDEVLTGATSATEPGFGVILGLADRRRLLRVDRVGRRREVVVRSLGELLSHVPGVSGCTELGDGRTILILDVLALFETGPAPAGIPSAPVLP